MSESTGNQTRTPIPAAMQEGADAFEIERKKTEDTIRLADQQNQDTNGINAFMFFIMLFLGKDSQLLNNNQAITEISEAFSINKNTLHNTIDGFQNGELTALDAARDIRSNITNTSNIDWEKAENAVSEYAQSGNPLLELIADKESGGDYNRVYGAGHKTAALTDMTINEVIAWQKNYTDNGSASSAAGKYQIIRKTLTGLKDEMGLTGNEKFDEAMQDHMATTLLERRGYDDLIAGTISEQDFMRNVSMEWAAAPEDMGGQSYYHGDGLNKALIAPETMLLAIRHTREDELQSTQLAANFSTALTATDPLQTDPKQPDPLIASFDGEGTDLVAAAAAAAQQNNETADPSVVRTAGLNS